MVSLSSIKDIQNSFPNARVSFNSSPSTGSLQYLNIRVTERLHRYRLLKRQWNDSQPTTLDSRSTISDVLPSRHDHATEQKVCEIKDYNIPIERTAAKENNANKSHGLEPLRTQIQRDLLQLRKMIKSRQNKVRECPSSKSMAHHRSIREVTFINSTENGQDKSDAISSSSFNRMKPLDHVQIAGCRVRSAIFPQNNLLDNGTVTISHSSSFGLQNNTKRQPQIKQQIHSTVFNISPCRINHSPASDPPIHGISSLKINLNTPQKPTTKQTQFVRRPTSSVTRDKQFDFTESETSLSPTQSDESTTCLYTYAATTSSTVPHSMKLNRTTSLLPILLTSNSCLGIQDEEKYREKPPNSHRSPKPIIPIHSQCNQDGYGILFSQLNRVRERMPNANVYNNYKRSCSKQKDLSC